MRAEDGIWVCGKTMLISPAGSQETEGKWQGVKGLLQPQYFSIAASGFTRHKAERRGMGEVLAGFVLRLTEC